MKPATIIQRYRNALAARKVRRRDREAAAEIQEYAAALRYAEEEQRRSEEAGR